jgi:glucans biosynthesis protein
MSFRVLKNQSLLLVLCLLCVVSPQPLRADDIAEAPTDFNFETVIARAKELADKPFDDASGKLQGDWLTLNYDDYRAVRFKAENALFKGKSPFEIHFFHSGFIFERMVDIAVVEGDSSTKMKFNPEWFRYDFTRAVPSYPEGMGFAGIRVHYPLNTDEYKDELIVFQGSSYFKFLGKGQKYGLSARGLAVDSGMNSPEEFPFYRQFWLRQPKPSEKTLTIYALLDSLRIAGAYEFQVTPGTNSVVHIRQVLFARADIEKVGIAPLSSMYFYGENKTLLVDDFRPEVHDSDGLLFQTGAGEWVWRPLVNRQWLTNTSFVDHNPRGFGLMQRDREFASYEDVEAYYHQRPSYWIEPTSKWGAGRIELVELPTNTEINDNIVSFWVPEKPIKAGDRVEFSYKVTSLKDPAELMPAKTGRTLQSRVGTVTRPGVDGFDPNGRIFVLDFVGEELNAIPANQPVEGVITHSSGKIENVVCHKHEFRDGWRLHFDFHPDGKTPADFRVYLKLGDKALSETWTYLWTPFDESVRVQGRALQ